MMLICTNTRPVPKISTPDYIGMGDSHNPTSSQSNRTIIPLPSRPNGNRIGKLLRPDSQVYPYLKLTHTITIGLLGKDIIRLWLWPDVALW